jgi:F-type H+-transporting ATPase subunit alpha
MAQFVKFGAEVDESTARQLSRGERARELLKQPQHTPLPMEHEAIILYAVVTGLLDEFPVERLSRFAADLFSHADLTHAETMTSLRETREMSASLEAEVFAMVQSFIAEWLARDTQAPAEGAEAQEQAAAPEAPEGGGPEAEPVPSAEEAVS